MKMTRISLAAHRAIHDAIETASDLHLKVVAASVDCDCETEAVAYDGGVRWELTDGESSVHYTHGVGVVGDVDILG